MSMSNLRRRLHHGDVDGRKNEHVDISSADALNEPLLGSSHDNAGSEVYDPRRQDLWDDDRKKEQLHWSFLFSNLIAQWAQWCKAPVAVAAKSASAQTPQGPDVTFLDDSVSDSPHTALNKTIDASSSTFPSSCQKLVTNATESISALSLQEPDVSSSDEFCDSSSEELITSSPRMGPHNTIDGSSPSTSSLGHNILIWMSPNYFEVFFIRIDQRRSFWIYPSLAGPFQSIDETDNAINHFLDVHCEPRSGTTKENTRSEKWYLVQAILDQFNDENNLSGVLAYELEDLLRKQLISENHRWYYHFNFTTKQKEVDDNPSTGKKLFFAEVSHMQGKSYWEVNCCRIIESEAKGGHCFGCKNNGSPDMQHPDETDAYTGGHLDGYLPFGCNDLITSDDDDDNNNEEDEDDDDDDDEDYYY